jgi:hypothetical protein
VTTHPAHNIDVTIERTLAEVYDFIGQPENIERDIHG